MGSECCQSPAASHGWQVVFFGPQSTLPTGSVLTFVVIDGQEFVDRLTPEGRVTRMALPPGGSVFGAGWVDMQGFLRLETSDDGSQWNLVHYALA